MKSHPAATASNGAMRCPGDVSGGVRSAEGRHAIDEMDHALRDARNSGNPGTTADLTAAAIFVVLIGGGWGPADGGDHAATR